MTNLKVAFRYLHKTALGGGVKNDNRSWPKRPTDENAVQELTACPLDGGVRGSTVVKVLCYKSEGRWFDPSWCQWIFHWHRNEYQEYFLGVKAASA